MSEPTLPPPAKTAGTRVRVVRIQPPPTPPMHTNGGSKNALRKPVDQRGHREWSYDLTDCVGDCGTCCFALFCPCIVFSKNKTRLEHLKETGERHPDRGTGFTRDCFYHFLLCAVCCNCLIQSGVRSKIRSRYRISDVGSDCCTGLCCTSCELTQESRELELEEESLIQRNINIRI